MKSKILIAGATGLIGRELVKECLKEGIDIHYLTTSKKKIEQKLGYQGFYWDPSNNIIDIAAFNGVTAIINLAGASVAKRWTASNKEEILQSRTQTTTLIYTTLKRINHSVLHYITASGVSVYPSSLEHLYAEKNPLIAETFLGKVVMAWEEAADKFLDLNIRVAKVRTGIVLSNTGGALSKMVPPIKWGVGAALGTGEQWQSWIHIKDLIRIYLYLLHNELSGIFNAVSPNPVTNKKMTQVIANHYNKSLWLPNIPAFVLKMILGSMANITLESQLVSSQKLVEMGFQFQFVNLENAIEDVL
ncbi:MAG: TIGR01777 family oxidoreductase [Flavobacteriaceae bacterium]